MEDEFSFPASGSCNTLRKILKGGLILALWMHLPGCTSDPPGETALQNASAAYAGGDFETSKRLAQELLSQDDSNAAARAVVIWSAVALGQISEAEQELTKVPESELPEVCRMLSHAGDRNLNEGRLTSAEQHFRSILSVDPRYPQANDRLAYLLRLTGRYREAAHLELELVKQGRMTVDILLALALGDWIFPNEPTAKLLEKYCAEVPDDPLPLAGLSRYALMTNDPARAEELARAALQRDSNCLTAYVVLGRALVDSGKIEELEQWRAVPPPGAEDDAGVWLVRGLWAKRQQDWTGAARCFGEALRREPYLRPANEEIPVVLKEAKAEDLVPLATERAKTMQELSLLTKAFQMNSENPEPIRRISEWMASEGRMLESHAWKHLAKVASPSKTGNAKVIPPGDAYPAQAPKPELEELIDGVNRFELPDWLPETRLEEKQTPAEERA